MKAIIMDMDGTLADHEHRAHLSTKRDWAAYNDASMQDPPVIPMVDLVHGMRAQGYTVVICTGRFEAMRFDTTCWLDKHHIHADYLFMRGADDMRSDYLVKEDMLTELMKKGFDIAFVVEDRKSVVDMWRSHGILTLHCAEGDFLKDAA